MVKHKSAFLVLVRLCCVFAILLLNYAHKPLDFSSHHILAQTQNVDVRDINAHDINNGDLSPSELKALLAFQICTTNSDGGLDKKQSDPNTQHCYDNTPCHACRIGGQLLIVSFASEIIQHKLESYKKTFITDAKPNRKFYFNYTTPARAPPLV